MSDPAVDDRVKVVVKLEKDEDDHPPLDYEGLWARPLGGGEFQLDNVPFFAKGIAYGDVISAVDVNQELQFRQVVRPSGHATLRLIIPRVFLCEVGHRAPAAGLLSGRRALPPEAPHGGPTTRGVAA